MRLYNVSFFLIWWYIASDIDTMPKKYEYIIVGAGPAGLRVAERLRDKSRVLILEASDRIGGSLPEWVLLREGDLRYFPEAEVRQLETPSLGNLMVCKEALDPERTAELQDYEDIHMYYSMGRGMPEYGDNVATHVARRESLIREPPCPVIFNTRVIEIERNQMDFCVHTQDHISYRAGVVIVAGAYGIRYKGCSPGVNTGLLGDYEFWLIRAHLEDDSTDAGPEMCRADTSCPINSYQINGSRVEAIGDLGYFARNAPSDGLVSQVLGFPVREVSYERRVCHYWNRYDDHPFYTGGVFVCGEVAVRHHGWVGESVRSADSAVAKVVSKA
jgi:hypothetical protein